MISIGYDITLVDGVDTSTINGRLFLNLMASLAEYERELIRERTNAGLQSARARVRIGGRPKGYTAETISKLVLLRTIYKDVTKRPEDIYKPFGLTRVEPLYSILLMSNKEEVV
ncbi:MULTISPECIES: recombinase family protein [unclassified Chryseobacterium]|uniref:recombinase family protein n=1 Tax=Chryseobacterium sp. Leaf313 TaxID=2876563 RepID=UPI00293425CC|nr:MULTISPECIES: recombinase family protein [unclassified Chryseobacterium]